MNDTKDVAVPAGAIEQLAERLKGRDPFEVQEELVPELRTAIAGMSRKLLATPEAPGKWSVLEVIQHLADAELAYGFRLRMILAHERPPLQGFDQDLWARELRYNQGDVVNALEQLSALRTANLRIFRALDEAQFDRIGIHSEAGPISARMILYILAKHDLTHRRQIERIKESVEAT